MELAVAVTRIQGIDELWDHCPGPLSASLNHYNKLITETVEAFEGTVLHENSCGEFAISFVSPAHAVRWALFAQEALLRIEWPEDLVVFEDCAAEFSPGGRWLWRGLRMAVGIHAGEDVASHEMDNGPIADGAARIAAAAFGGQVLISWPAWILVCAVPACIEGAEVAQLGSFQLNGSVAREKLYQVVPGQLKNRRYPSLQVTRL